MKAAQMESISQVPLASRYGVPLGYQWGVIAEALFKRGGAEVDRGWHDWVGSNHVIVPITFIGVRFSGSVEMCKNVSHVRPRIKN